MAATTFWNAPGVSGRPYRAPNPSFFAICLMDSPCRWNSMTSSRLKVFRGRCGVPAGPTIDGLSHFSAVEVLLVTQPASLGPLPNQSPLELRRGTQDMEQESRRRILQVRVEPLRHSDEPGALLFQRLDVVQAV